LVRPRHFAAGIFAFVDDRFATDILFKTAFAFCGCHAQADHPGGNGQLQYAGQYPAAVIERTVSYKTTQGTSIECRRSPSI
jgi:hypothetical protein